MQKTRTNAGCASAYRCLYWRCVFWAFLAGALRAAAADSNVVRIVELSGGAEILRINQTIWTPATVNGELHGGDRLRLKGESRATLRLSDMSLLRLGEFGELQIGQETGLNGPFLHKLWKGLLYFFHRGKPGRIHLETPTASAAVLGTEVNLLVQNNGATLLTVIDGEVGFTSNQKEKRVRSGQEGFADGAADPIVRPLRVEVTDVVQWCLYYPGVLHVDELQLEPGERAILSASLEAYQHGDVLAALQKYPANAAVASDATRIYRAAVLLAVGNVEDAGRLLDTVEQNRGAGIIVDSPSRLARSLRKLIQIVKNRRFETNAAPVLATEWLVESYARQFRRDLGPALAAAYEAVGVAANFGCGWQRVAELEFSFGRNGRAEQALNRALAFAPRNPEALALKGFLLAARNRPSEAIDWFSGAIAIDGGLGNAWLGRGLCRVRQGDSQAGLVDLETAAALEPQRSIFRSYLGKAFGNAGDDRRALQELDLAKRFDPLDPTSWLYSGLINQERNRINEAVADLEKSKELNDNRALFRSRMLLDQDRAVRSASLASIYGDARMFDVSLREGAQAVEADYANYSAHLFLANSYDALRDPTRFNLRYETSWFNELLLANLLAPPGVPTISANISQQEYSRLFEHDRLGLSTTTELRSDGQYNEKASQFGAWGPFSYSLDLDWQRNEGVRPNNELNRTEWYSQLKYQLTPQDSIFALIKYQDYDSGDNFQYYDASSARPQFHYSQTQMPLLLAGWHHEWSPGIHTLFLGGRLVNDQQLSDTVLTQTVAVVNPVGVLDPSGVPFDVNYQSDFEIYSAELNQIFQRENHTDILGARFQDGTFRADNTFGNPPTNLASLFTLPSVSETDNDFRRVSVYAYHHWEIIDSLVLIGGVVYDDLRYPANFRRPPLSTDELHRSQVSPKAAILWDITPNLRVRAAYAQGIGGVSYDESVRLEPTQLAGFSQSFRSLISESLVGSVESPRHEIIGSAIDLRPWTNAWLSLQGEVSQERVDREIGIFNYNFSDSPPATPASANEQLDYHEFNARVIFNQLVGSAWSLEAQYQFTRSELERTLPDIAATAGYARTSRADADLHQFGLAATWQHPSGFFARGDFRELLQRLGGSSVQPRGDNFPLLNLFLGYRLPRRRGALTLGVMNLCGKDYHFSPLNYHPEFPHERVFYTRFTLNF